MVFDIAQYYKRLSVIVTHVLRAIKKVILPQTPLQAILIVFFFMHELWYIVHSLGYVKSSVPHTGSYSFVQKMFSHEQYGCFDFGRISQCAPWVHRTKPQRSLLRLELVAARTKMQTNSCITRHCQVSQIANLIKPRLSDSNLVLKDFIPRNQRQPRDSTLSQPHEKILCHWDFISA